MAEPWLNCTHWIGAEARICGAQAAHRYLPGPRCPDHTPAALAGRAESVPDPARTIDGLRQGPSISERRSQPRTRCRPASRVGQNGKRYYTSADVDLAKVHRAMKACAPRPTPEPARAGA